MENIKKVNAPSQGNTKMMTNNLNASLLFDTSTGKSASSPSCAMMLSLFYNTS